jgi:hypothetical protein
MYHSRMYFSPERAQQHKPTRGEQTSQRRVGPCRGVRVATRSNGTRTQSLSSPWESVAGCVVLIQQQQQEEEQERGVTGEVIWLGGGGAIAPRSTPRSSAGLTR